MSASKTLFLISIFFFILAGVFVLFTSQFGLEWLYKETFFSQGWHDALVSFFEYQVLDLTFWRFGVGRAFPYSSVDWKYFIFALGIIFSVFSLLTHSFCYAYRHWFDTPERRRLKMFITIKTLKDVKEKLDPESFEYFTAFLYEKFGYSANRVGFGADVKKTAKDGIYGDGGKDVVLRKGLFRRQTIVQCKFYTGAVGVSVVRELYGVLNHFKVKHGIIITPSFFSKDAKNFAKGKHIDLVDGKKIEKMLKARA